ncbi:78-dihydro-8-oxoguanine triphosphatase [Thiolapillus brandeum]|uniref:8-oxo-dGTP diphosphatase n=1 Tax=Thiolapillus brandeum TaxID=1076588 RepID=A0A7U6GH46_9GAMM|nr:78-dihydro-8-oxoguanine triphosphatase [Thiolapillus brandeum]
MLLAQRRADSHQGGLWEFPGGKVESGESVREALDRELKEELGIEVQDARPLIRVPHAYADCRVLLDTWLVSRWQGEPRGLEGQPLAWVSMGELTDRSMPAADMPILDAIRLPDTCLITPPSVADATRFLQALRKAVSNGVSLVQFRVFGLAENDLEDLALASRRLCEEFGAKMLVNGPLELALKSGAHGWHLNRRHLRSLKSSRDYAGLLLGASCHDAEELALAREKGVHFVLLSPVLPTASHPDAEVLGWKGFSDLVAEFPLPVYALGGMNASLLEHSWRAGAQGIAGIRGLWPD